MNKLLCSCCLCRNELTTNLLSIHYGTRQCRTGHFFKERLYKARDLKCSFCTFIGKSNNSIVQHELYCDNNPNKKYRKPSYGMLGKKGKGVGSNQFTKARKDGLPIPIVSEETKRKMQLGRRDKPNGYYSKQSIETFKQLLESLKDVDCGRVQHAEQGGEFWLTPDRERYYLYDLCFRDLKVIIEFQGTTYHPKSLTEEFKPPFRNMGTKEDVWNKDRLKENLARSNGYIVEYIWSDNIQNDVVRISQLIRLLAKDRI